MLGSLSDSDCDCDLLTTSQAMLHVDAAFSAAATGTGGDPDAGYDSRIINQVHRLVDLFEEECGRDLTIQASHNPFWHTGNHVPLDSGPAREKRPWEFIWDVAAGRSGGKWGARSQSHGAYVQHYLSDCMFTK